MKLTAKCFDELTTGELYEILKSRQEIFMAEQRICCVDTDGLDYDCLHCFFMENGRVAAYLRACYVKEAEGLVKIGRVLTLEHGKGVGGELLRQSLCVIKERFRCRKICVAAQKHAENFYRIFGFVTVSDEFLEEGIPHVHMELEI